MTRLIIHAGFPKTGSSSIQSAIGRHISRLNDRGFYMFGEKMVLGRDGLHPGLPLWSIEEAARDGRNLSGTIKAAVSEVGPDATLLLTSENLSQLNMPSLFVGVDHMAEVTVVFYMRPQLDWIPSAWKQWGLKRGLTLRQWADQVMRHGRPPNLASIRAWKEHLPSAHIIVRPFFKGTMVEGDPAIDFFSVVGYHEFHRELLDGVTNPSIDYSILHAMMLSADSLFTGIHDVELENELAPKLPAWARAANIPMLSDELASEIEQFYRSENIQILNEFCDIGDADDFYERNFLPKKNDGKSYMDADETATLTRCFRILAEASGKDQTRTALASMMKNLKDWRG